MNYRKGPTIDSRVKENITLTAGRLRFMELTKKAEKN